jgi:hypothetical protein
MGGKWVKEGFKHILTAHCQQYLECNDLGRQKLRTMLVNDVAAKIREAAAGQELPDDLTKVSGDSEFNNEVLITSCSLCPSGSETRPKEPWAKMRRIPRGPKGRAAKIVPESNGQRDQSLRNAMKPGSTRFISNISPNMTGMVLRPCEPIPLL